jgi:AcrR family transcriptional regulator
MDPRMDRTRQHVLACAREIMLARGADAVTFSEVGRVARVSRNTLYRHWPTREKLLADLTLSYYADQEGGESAETGVGSVADFLRLVRENLNEPGSVETLSLLISRADHDPATAQALRDVAQLRQETLSKVTGPLTDAEFALIIGPLLFQAVIARRPVTDEFLEEVAAASAARSDC